MNTAISATETYKAVQVNNLKFALAQTKEIIQTLEKENNTLKDMVQRISDEG
jgi:hypothetical protein